MYRDRHNFDEDRLRWDDKELDQAPKEAQAPKWFVGVVASLVVITIVVLVVIGL